MCQVLSSNIGGSSTARDQWTVDGTYQLNTCMTTADTSSSTVDDDDDIRKNDFLVELAAA